MADAARTGFDNIRLNPQTTDRTESTAISVKLDYLQWIGECDRQFFDHVISTLSEFFDDVWELVPGRSFTRGRRWENSGRSGRGGVCAWNEMETGKIQCWFSLGSQVISRSSNYQELLELIRDLRTIMSARFTRVDVALDDYTKSLDPMLMLEAVKHRNYAGFQSFDPRFPLKNGEYAGFTLYFGSRESDKLTRYYDKDVESKGLIKAYRLETEFRRGCADSMVGLMLQVPNDAAMQSQLLSGAVLGSIDFLDRQRPNGGIEENLSRCQRLDWWQEFIDRIGSRIKLTSPPRKRALQRSLDWIDRQVSPTIALLKELFGAGFYTYLDQKIEQGKDRLTAFQRKMIQHERRKILELKNGIFYEGKICPAST